MTAHRWELDESDLPTLRKLRALWRTAEKIERGWCARWTARVLARYFEKTVENVTARVDASSSSSRAEEKEEIPSDGSTS